MTDRLLARLLPPDDWRAFQSEQQELFDTRRARDGDRAAARARRADARRLVLRLLIDRWRGSAPGGPAHDPRAARPLTTRLGDLWRDVRHAARSLARAPGLTATVVLTVGLGLGATTAMVSVIHAVLIAPLPYVDADRLVQIRTASGENRYSISVVDYRAIEAQQVSFDAVAAAQIATATVSVNGVAEQQRIRIVTSGYFSLLGLTPRVGRLFDASDAHTGGRSVALSEEFWRSHYGASPSVVGQQILIDGTPRTIVGVQAGVDGPLEHGNALFEIEDWPVPKRKGPFFLSVLARLKPSESMSAASDDMHGISRRLFPIWRSSYQDANATWVLIPLKDRLVAPSGQVLWLVFVSVAAVLLIAWVNAAGLLVARGLERRRELAVRAALGASRAQLARVMFAESAILAMAAAGLGAAVAFGGVRLVLAYGGAYLPRIDEVRLGGPARWWLLVLAAASALAIGALPALGSSRLAGSLRLDGGTRTTEGRAARLLRRLLVAAEFALATPLVVAAGLIVGSLHQLMHVDVGMDGRHVVTTAVSLPATQYPTSAEVRAFWDRARAAFLARPGVIDVAFSDSRPPDQADDLDNFDLEAHPTPANEHQPVCPWIAVTPDFFRTTGLALVRGRVFDVRDDADTAPPVVLVDRVWAHRFFGTEAVVGQRLRDGGCTTCPWTTVVGVVATVKYLGLDQPDDGTVYMPMRDDVRDRFVIARTAGIASAMKPAMAGIVRGLDPNLAVAQTATVDDLVASSIEMPRYLSVIAALFAGTALLLSVVGIYGVMAHFVLRHRREIGIRLALGGPPDRIGRMVVASGLKVVGPGVAAGLGMSLLVTRLMSSVLFGIAPTDATTFVAVPVLMTLIAVAACALPARRAARVEPAVVLRDA